MDKILNLVLSYAFENKCSDIHISVKEKVIKLSYRNKDGLVESNYGLSLTFVNHLLYISNLDISLNGKPQTSVFEYFYNYQKYAIRVACVSAFNNLSIVLRILNQEVFKEFDDLTDDSKSIELFETFKSYDYGIIMISGPTGSGKTTTAYTLLKSFVNKAIYTIEDPIEIFTDKFIQLQLNSSLGFDYHSAIKQILRHDPDVIFIGEVRDSVSAQIAVRCALSGHLVVLTVHSASCYSTVKRFLDFGVNKDDLKEVLKAIVNQRLHYQDKVDRFYARYEIATEQGINI